MSTPIPEVVDAARVRSAEFIKLTITTSTTTVYTFSSSYRAETISGQRYTPVGGLLQVGQQNRDLKATSADTSISLTGLDPDNIFMVLGQPIRGSVVEIYRGFYLDNYTLSTSTVVKRFTGVVTSYNLSEDFDNDSNSDVFTIAINCSSYKTVLENNIGGRRTNQETWDILYAGTDTSMVNVPKLNGAFFDFGVPVT